MTGIELPTYLIDLERLHRNIQYGDVAFRFKKAGGRVVKLIALFTQSLRFRSNDEALLYMVDAVKSLPTDKDGKVVMSIEHKAGRVLKIETSVEEELDYPMDAPRH